ncbi:MAG TPA: GAF domain-containing sensor histidine kinase [Nostocaceae cyanobacterium]|nr:GAF domain-containing sensor histidine kinase [Nostocaceae cyanobacterium]
MLEPESKLLALKDGWTSLETKEQQRLKVLSELGLRQPETIPVFEEATQTAAHFLEAPISILGFIDHELHWFKSAVGLSRLGLMNNLAQTRQLVRRESFCSQVVENLQVLVINDTHKLADSLLGSSQLVRNYGIRSYLGAPLIDAAGNCLGSLAVMDLVPRNFTNRDIEFLQIIARWSMSEFERNRLLLGKTEKNTINSNINLPFKEESVTDLKINTKILEKNSTSTKQLKLELLSQLTQELRTPLTSVLGMASVLGREIYGPLTTKQREYLEIIQHSGRYLLSLVNEITELGAMDEGSNVLNLAPVDIEMLCQQAINTLEEVATRREQDIRLSIEPGRSRIWPLDKEKVRQILYHLIFSVIQISATGSIVRIHVSYKEDTLSITVWVSHPWLGDGIDFINPLPILDMVDETERYSLHLGNEEIGEISENAHVNGVSTDLTKISSSMSREKLGLLLSCHLAELHGGQIAMQGSPESGYRYVLSLPLQSITTAEVVSDA